MRYWLIVVIILPIVASSSGCPVNIKNLEFCRDKGKLGAVCSFWLNARETKKNIPLAEWNAKRLGMFCTSPEGMGNINALIETFCQARECVEQTKELIKALKDETNEKN